MKARRGGDEIDEKGAKHRLGTCPSAKGALTDEIMPLKPTTLAGFAVMARASLQARIDLA
jgi:hypothetical protein